MSQTGLSDRAPTDLIAASHLGDAQNPLRRDENGWTRYLEVRDLGSELELVVVSYIFARFNEASGTSACNGLASDPVETGHPQAIGPDFSEHHHDTRSGTFVLVPATFLEGLFDVALGVAVGDSLALVIELLAARNTDIHFGPTVAQPHAQWHEGHPLSLGLATEVFDLTAVNQQFTGAGRIVVRIGAMGIRRDVGADQPQLVVVDAHVRLTDGDLSFTNRFDFRPGQHHASLDAVIDEVFVKRAAILRDDTITPGRRACVFPFGFGHFPQPNLTSIEPYALAR